MVNLKIIGIQLTDGDIVPLAYTDRLISKKELRRLVKKFRTDIDFVRGVVLNWTRLYSSFNEFKTLPKI